MTDTQPTVGAPNQSPGIDADEETSAVPAVSPDLVGEYGADDPQSDGSDALHEVDVRESHDVAVADATGSTPPGATGMVPADATGTAPAEVTGLSPTVGTGVVPAGGDMSNALVATTDSDGSDPSEAAPHVARLEREGDIAADYLEELLDIVDLDGDLDMDVEGDRAMVSVVGADLSQLVGHDGAVLEALQELTRLAVYRKTGERSRLMLDISGYRARRREELVAEAKSHIDEARRSGARVSLAPMSAFDRKVVHDTVAASGLISESEGIEPRRYVVIVPE